MSFPLPLIRFTARRSGDADLPVLYPRLLRDRSVLPKVAIAIEHFHGAATGVPIGDTAYALRHTGYNVLFVAQWLDPADDERCIQWCRDAYQSLQPFISPWRYVNYLGEDDMAAAGSLASVYGPNLGRLQQIKKRYDPDNAFRLNLNIPPA